MAAPDVICKGPGCRSRAVVAIRDVPLCLPHSRRIEWQLAALSMKLAQLTGNILDLLDFDTAQAHLGRALAAESELAKKQLRRAVQRRPSRKEPPVKVTTD